MLELPVLRTTAMQALRECPKRWSVEHLDDDGDIDVEDREDGNEFTERGRAVHTCCEATLRGAVDVEDEGQWEGCDQILKAARVPRNERQNARDYCGELQQRKRNPQWKLLAVEARFVRPLVPGAPPIKGTPDVIWQDLEGECYVIQDHKTNRMPRDADWWRGRLQQRTYAWAVRAALLSAVKHPWLAPGRTEPVNERVIDFEIGCVNLGTSVRWRTSIADDVRLVEEYSELWQELQVYHRTGEWPERLNSYCSSCPVLVGCRSANDVVNELQWIGAPDDVRPVPDGPLARLERLKATIKVAEALEQRAKDEVLALVHAQGAYQEGSLFAELRDTAKRSAQFWDVWAVLEPWLERGVADWFNDLFTVKIGELDQLCRSHPDLTDLLEAAGAIHRISQERLVISRV